MRHRVNISQNSNYLEISKSDNAFRQDSNTILIAIIILSLFSLPFIFNFVSEGKLNIELGILIIGVGFFVIWMIKDYKKLRIKRKEGLIIRFNKDDFSLIINNNHKKSFEDIKRIIIEYLYNDGSFAGYALYLRMNNDEKVYIDESNNKDEIFSLAAEISIITNKLIKKIDKK